MMPAKYLRVFNPLNPELNPICHLLALLRAHPILHVSRIRVKFYLCVLRTLTAEYDVCGTQVYSALLTEGLRPKQIMTCKTVVSETDTATSIWSDRVGYGNVMSASQLPMFQCMLPPNSSQLETATRLCITITKMTTKCSHL